MEIPWGCDPKTHRQLTRDRLAEVVEHHNVTVVNADKNEFFSSYREGPRRAFYSAMPITRTSRRSVDLLWARSVGAATICGDDYHPVLHKGVTRAR